MRVSSAGKLAQLSTSQVPVVVAELLRVRVPVETTLGRALPRARATGSLQCGVLIVSRPEHTTRVLLDLKARRLIHIIYSFDLAPPALAARSHLIVIHVCAYMPDPRDPVQSAQHWVNSKAK